MGMQGKSRVSLHFPSPLVVKHLERTEAPLVSAYLCKLKVRLKQTDFSRVLPSGWV